MSRTTTVSVGDRGFWVLDDAFAVWLTYLVDETGRVAPDPWLTGLAEDWRGVLECPDLGEVLPELPVDRARLLLEVATGARLRAAEAGDVPWDFTRTGKDHVEVGRVLEVADGFVALLDGTMPADPPGGAWFLGTGEGWAVMPYRQDSPALNQPRFARW
ncbi:hypothetical protein [Lentzea sp.]|uniref:hypothetical protein n=1 Tax=Lentzea sp. TaxID=56099 RepID=UPI002ED19696